jgi:hypothetical protein
MIMNVTKKWMSKLANWFLPQQDMEASHLLPQETS